LAQDEDQHKDDSQATGKAASGEAGASMGMWSQQLSTTRLGNLHAGSMRASVILGQTVHKNVPRRTAWEAVSCGSRNVLREGQRCLCHHHPPPCFTLTLTAKRSNDGLNTEDWIWDKPCLVTIHTGPLATIARPDTGYNEASCTFCKQDHKRCFPS
jgi:hypothetical protein